MNSAMDGLDPNSVFFFRDKLDKPLNVNNKVLTDGNPYIF